MSHPVFQNENFIVCDKDAEVLSVPARAADDGRRCLGLELQKRLKIQIYPVHRLDYEVSGLIIYALNRHSHQLAQTWFEQKSIVKKYAAITSAQDFSHWPEKVPTDRQVISSDLSALMVWKTQILRGKRRAFESTAGDWAQTEARLFAQSNCLRWDLYPVTGKSHQLRFELSRRGFPIWGDQLYGSQHEWKLPGIALRAYQIDLTKVTARLGLPEKIEIKKWDV